MRCWALLLVVLLSGCKFEGGSLVQQGSTGQEPTGVRTRKGVPATGKTSDGVRGDWRLASPLDLERAVMRVSHLLVRHKESRESQAPFILAIWKALPPPPQRSREEALRIAERLRARADVDSFAQLVAEHSEDANTSKEAGDLGVIRASNFSVWPEVLDALAAIEPGELSEVVESEFGFHIFLRQALPSPGTLSGKHIVIGHEGAPWLRFAERKGHAEIWEKRSPDEALRIARRLSTELRESPERFDALVREYSDHFDAERDGDVGNWSTWEAGPHARALSRLAEVSIGDIMGPIPTFYGYSIWQRTASSPRPEYATEGLRLNYKPEAAPQDPLSRRSVKAKAEGLLKDLLTNPSHFGQSFQEFGEPPQRWTEGRGRPGVAKLVQATEEGAFLPEFVELENAFFVLRHVAPETVPLPPEPSSELPLPREIALGYYYSKLPPIGRTELLERSVGACDLTEATAFLAFAREELQSLEEQLSRRIFLRERQELTQELLSRLESSLRHSSDWACIRRELGTHLKGVFLQ